MPDRTSNSVTLHKSQRRARSAKFYTLCVHVSAKPPSTISAVVTVDMGCCSCYLTLCGWHEAQQQVAVQMAACTRETSLQALAGCSSVQSSLATGRL